MPKHLYLIIPALALSAPQAVGSGQLANQKISTLYDVRWEGLKIGEFDLDLALGEDSYSIEYQAESTGAVGVMIGFKSAGSSGGARDGGKVRAAVYRGMSEWRGGGSRWSVNFDDQGRAVDILIPQDSTEERGTVPADLKLAPDPLGLALQSIIDIAPGSVIEGDSFDGKRAVRYRLECPTAEDDPISMVCSAEGRLVAGGSAEPEERRDSGLRANDSVLLTMQKGILEGHYWPVRIEATSSYGDVAIELVETSS